MLEKLRNKGSFYLRIVKHLIVLFKIFRKLRKMFTEKELENVRPYKLRNWHHGFLYFTAIFNQKKVFLKVDTQYFMIKNEEAFYNIFGRELKEYLVPMAFCYYRSSFQVLSTEYFSASELQVDELNEENLKSILLIVDNIYSYNVIHRDIKLSNFLISDGRLKIIDFSFCIDLHNKKFKEIDLSLEKNIETLKGLNQGLKPCDLQWNDYYSLSAILSQHKELIDENVFFKYKKIFELKSKNKSYCLEDLNA